MDNQDNQNIKVKRTKKDIKLYNRLYYAYVKKNDKKVTYKFVDFTNAWSKFNKLLDEFYQ